MGKTQFTPDIYRFSDSRGYCEVYQEISQILIKYPVITGISQGMADAPTLRSKPTGRCNKCPAPFGTWNLNTFVEHYSAIASEALSYLCHKYMPGVA